MLIRYTSSILGAVVLLIILYGLYMVVYEELALEAHSKEGAEGRILLNTKNVTSINGTPDSIFNYTVNAIPYKEINHPSFAPDNNNWKEFVKKSIPARENPGHILLLPGEGKEALVWALPGIFYAKYYGSPVLFSNESNDSLLKIYSETVIYVLAPEEVIPDRNLPRETKIKRISGSNPFDHAVKIAEFRDEETEFGWGRTQDKRDGYFHYLLTTPGDALKGLAALAFAKSNNATLLYVSDQGGITAETDRYIWQQRTDWMVSPSEGPFRHFWIVSEKPSYATRGRIDFSIEKAEYPSLGPIALGPMEAVAILLILWGFAGAIFVFIHSMKLLPDVLIVTKIAWSFTALLVPVIGVLLYFSAYRRPVFKVKNGMIHWLRPHSIQSAAATAVSFGFGAPIMIAIGYVFVFYGFPLFFGENLGSSSFYFLGAGMPLMMIGMYILSVLIAWPLVQLPMKEMMMEMSKKDVLIPSLKVTAISMFAVSIGMMTTAWWLMMGHIPMMPEEDSILWFGSMWFASLIGFLIAWPLNWPMVLSKLKPGNM